MFVAVVIRFFVFVFVIFDIWMLIVIGYACQMQ